MAERSLERALLEVAPPVAPVYRVARLGSDPFAPPSWDHAGTAGTFGGHFDAPNLDVERSPSERHRIIYCATQRAAAFGETIVRFRPSLHLIAVLEEVDDVDSVLVALDRAVDPEDPRRCVIPASWRFQRRLGQTLLGPSLRFADITSGKTLHQLRQVFAPLATAIGLSDIDLSAVIGPQRQFTQACARYIYDQVSETGQPRYAGIRYLSRLNAEWECWAIFADRMQHTPGLPVSIFPDDPGLLEAAALLGLTIESFEGHYVRPWR